MYHKKGAYDRFDSQDEVPVHYARRRKIQDFILSDEGVLRESPRCSLCGEPITIERGNRGEYDPKTKTMVLFHYDCAWKVTLDQVFSLRV